MTKFLMSPGKFTVDKHNYVKKYKRLFIQNIADLL